MRPEILFDMRNVINNQIDISKTKPILLINEFVFFKIKFIRSILLIDCDNIGANKSIKLAHLSVVVDM